MKELHTLQGLYVQVYIQKVQQEIRESNPMIVGDRIVCDTGYYNFHQPSCRMIISISNIYGFNTPRKMAEPSRTPILVRVAKNGCRTYKSDN